MGRHFNNSRIRSIRQAGEDQFVFVYGSLKAGFSNNARTGLCEYAQLSDGYTVDTEWTMKSYGGFPAVLEGGKEAIWGEVYVIDDYMMAVLDHLEGFPKFYDRQMVSVFVDGEDKIEAWMYYMPEDSQYVQPKSTKGVDMLDFNGTKVANWVGGGNVPRPKER